MSLTPESRVRRQDGSKVLRNIAQNTVGVVSLLILFSRSGKELL